jgi:hypothetical protein
LWRRRSIQVGNPDEIRILATMPGKPITDETLLHDRFRHLWIRGEWYRPESELLAFITDAATPWLDPRSEGVGAADDATVMT